MKQQPSYYAVLPANVRYDKRLKPLTRILYAEITALSNKNGYCNAANSYFAELYEVAIETVSRYISQLVACGYLRHEVDQEQGNERRLYPIDQTVNTSIDKTVNTPIDRKVNTPIDQTVMLNNTSKNNTSIDIIVELVEYLNKASGRSFSPKTKATRQHLAARLKEGYTPEQIRAVIDDRVERWANDAHMAEYLRPNTLFAGKFESYLQAAQSAPQHANTDEALNDCELGEAEEAAYQNYIKYTLNNYLNLFKSQCRIFSKSEYIDYLTNKSLPGVQFLVTPNQKKEIQLKLHSRLNSDKYFREKYLSVWEAYRAAMKAIANHEKPLV